MPTTIKLKNSVTTTNAPSSLAQGEVAINITDKKVWVGNAATTPVQIVGAGTTGNAAGSNTQVQYNSSGSFAGSANFTFNGTTVTMANDASISGLTVGKGGGAVVSNTVLGVSAGTSNTTGAYNTFVGGQDAVLGRAAGQLNTTGSINTAIGGGALGTNTTGSNNTAVGYRSLAVSTASNNTAFGAYSLYTNTTGTANVAIGRDALAENTTASGNMAVGYQAGYSNTTGGQNDFLGYQAGYGNTTGQDNNFVGYLAGRGNTTANYNTAIGTLALGSTSNNGSHNIGIGYYALSVNTGGNNTAIGSLALQANTTASNNTAVGYEAGYTSATSNEQTFIGYRAGKLITGAQNTMIGSQAGVSATTGVNNTFVGYGAGGSVTTGGKNSILGSYSGNQGGLDIRTASNYIVLSDGDGNPRAICDNNGYWTIGTTNVDPSGNGVAGIALRAGGLLESAADGTYAVDFGRNTNDGQVMRIRRSGTVVGSITVTTTATAFNTSSDVRLKENIADAGSAINKINSIQIRSFDWKANKEHQDFGVIAQELEKVAPEAVAKGETEEDMWSVDYSKLVPSLIKYVQELKAEVDSLKAQLNK